MTIQDPSTREPDAAHSADPERRPLPLLRLILLPVLIVGAGLAVFGMLSRFKQPPTKRAQELRLPLVDVMTVRARPYTLDLHGYGSVRAKRIYTLAPQVAGRVVKLSERFEAGRFVKAGETLVEIDPTDYRIALASAQAQLEQARAEIVQLTTAEATLRDEVEVMRQKAEVSKSEYERMETTWVKDPGAISVTERDRSRGAYLADRTALVTRESALKLMPSRIAVAKAAAAAREEALRKAETDLARTRLACPFDGRVLSRSAEIGQFVTTFPATGVGQVADLSAFEVPVVLEAEQFGNLPGQPAQSLPEGAAPAREFAVAPKATVKWLAHGGRFEWPGLAVRAEPMDASSRTIPLVVEVRDPWGGPGSDERPPLPIGAYCEVTIEGRYLEQALAVPERALQADGRLYVVADGKLAARAVQPRHRQDGELLVEGELKAGEKVVLSPLAFLGSGEAVRTREVEADEGPDVATGGARP
ncbi:MAG: biotin/lipoyl-binding protein [Planctomycetota bacterium]|nr:biotin/lipoyl-binding protein [Planctomycetota bacterium]